MRVWDSGFKAMLAGNEITRCFMVEAVSRLGQTVRLTDIGSDLFVSGHTFVANPGFHLTNFVVATGGAPPQVDVQLPVSDDGPIYADDVRRGVWRQGTLNLWMADFTNPSSRQLIASGFIGSIAFTDQLIGTIEIVTKGDALADIVLARVQPKCRHRFGSAGCGFDVSTRTLPATIATITSNSKFTITVTNPSAFDFNFGALQMTSGADSGASADIRKWTSGTSLVELWSALPKDLTVGDTLNIHAGCARTRAACAAYSNINHFGGYDHVPGDTYGGV